jgi:fructose-bisphosphate aldolase, class II
MSLVTGKALLEQAAANHYAIGAFNANNMEQVQAIIETAQEERAPVILQVSQGAIRYAGLAYAAGLVKIAASTVDVPVVLHLDHGTDFEQNVRCLHAGFTSLMFDGSKLSLDENIRITRSIVEVAHLCGIPVEAELGRVGQSSEKLTPDQVEALMTNPDQAEEFLRRSGADTLAVAVGSVHAMRSSDAALDIARIKAIRAKVGVPLVLHGSSGVRADSITEAIQYGIAKINVATYLNQAFIDGIREGLAKYPDEVDPRKAMTIARDRVKERVREKIRLFASNGRIGPDGGLVSPPTQHRSAHLGEAEA